MIAAHFAREQLVAPDLALGIELAHALLFLVGDAAGHWPRWHKHRWQVAEAQRADHQTRHDLVANAKAGHTVIHRMAQRHPGRQRNHITAEKRQLHPVFALRHPVAHGGGAAGNLRRCAHFAGVNFHPFRITAIGLMRAQHIIIGGDDTDIWRAAGLHRGLVIQCPGIGMGEV